MRNTSAVIKVEIYLGPMTPDISLRSPHPNVQTNTPHPLYPPTSTPPLPMEDKAKYNKRMKETDVQTFDLTAVPPVEQNSSPSGRES